MEQRINLIDLNKDAIKGLYNLEAYLAGCGLETSLLHLVKFRVSQINGCAYCLDMHSKDLRAAGETEQRLYLLDAWREAPFYTERERAALAWAESVTLVAETHVPDDVYEEARKQFSETELANLTLAVVTINAWNRLSVAFRVAPGTYQPAQAHTPTAAGATQ
jgi:AhpD family alkylhydroperoxidase